MKGIFDLAVENKLNTTIFFIFAIAAGLVLPMFLVFVVRYTGYSEIFEEAAKALVVFFVILKLPKFKLQALAAVIFGFLFGMSESMLYLNNIFQIGNFSVFWQRLFLTIPMHIATVLIMLYFAALNKKFVIFGALIAIAFHLFFNQFIVEKLIIW